MKVHSLRLTVRAVSLKCCGSVLYARICALAVCLVQCFFRSCAHCLRHLLTVASAVRSSLHLHNLPQNFKVLTSRQCYNNKLQCNLGNMWDKI